MRFPLAVGSGETPLVAERPGCWGAERERSLDLALRLLQQPGGFEGVGRVRVVSRSNHAAIFQLPRSDPGAVRPAHCSPFRLQVGAGGPQVGHRPHPSIARDADAD
jgi:hypothetical protein